MARYTIYQPAADDDDDLSNAVLTLFDGTPQSICGLPPGEYRPGMLNWADPVTVPTVNLLLNTVFAGGVTGTPGTPPTGWLQTDDGSTVTYTGDEVQIAASASRTTLRQERAVSASTVYFWSILASLSVTLQIQNVASILNLPSGATIAYSLDGAPVAATALTGTGLHTLGVLLTVGGTPGSPTVRFGPGIQSAVTATVTFSDPQFQVGTARTVYQAITATS